MSLTFTDVFCGAGGSSLGLTAAGLELRLAANHWDRAIETHSANFTDAEHLCADVSNYDMRRLPSTDVLWASPICTENSPAGGRRRSRGQLALLEHGPVASAGFERTRATFHDVIRATEVHRYSAVVVENVVEAADWELFDWWVTGMCQLRPGYRVQYLSVSSAHVGGPGNDPAPQWRDRLYLVFTRAGVPLPDLDPRPVAWCRACGVDVPAVQSWKRPTARRIGKYRAQYLYRCPNESCRHAVVEPYVLPAAAAIDWSDLGRRIGDRKRPLAAATMRRIRAGLELFAGAAVLVDRRDGNGPDRPRVRDAAGEPVGTVTAGGQSNRTLVVPPYLVPAGGTWNDDPAGVDQPMRTRTARAAEGLFTPPPAPPPVLDVDHHVDHHGDGPAIAGPFVTMLRGPANRPTGIDEPVATVTTGSNHYLTTPEPFVTMLRANGTATGTGEPLATLAAAGNHHALTVPPGAGIGAGGGGGRHALVIPYRRAKPKTTAEPLLTLATRDSAALVAPAVDVDVDVDDCRFRMLKPREHLRAQRIGDTYVVLGNQGEQTMQAGNAVSANVAQWIGERIAAALGGAA